MKETYYLCISHFSYLTPLDKLDITKKERLCLKNKEVPSCNLRSDSSRVDPALDATSSDEEMDEGAEMMETARPLQVW